MSGINTPLADHSYSVTLFKQRAVIAAIICILFILGLLYRLVNLQIVDYEHFSSLSESNRIRLMALAPTRGLIYDRNGVLLAENRPTRHLEIIPEQVKDLDDTLERLSKVIRVDEEDIEQFRSNLRSNRPFESISLRTRLNEQEVAKFAVHRHEFSGVDIAAKLTRWYPQGESAAHVIGYVGRISDKEIRSIDQSNYSATTHIGKTGIEKYYEKLLHGKVGYQKVEVNSEGRILNVLDKVVPVPGANLILSLDIELQKVAEKELGGFSGAVVANEPNTGEVLVFVSKPMFDPNLFVHGISHADYDRLRKSDSKPLFNRAIYGQYPPGSTFKPFIALAGLENKLITSKENIKCEGFYLLPDDDERRYRDWKKEGHGGTDLVKAMEQSCDVYFYELSYRLGITKIYKFLSQFGFGKKTGIDLIGERSGLLPSREWKRRVYNMKWFPGETVIAGIGQGYMLATPMQLAEATSILATKGIHKTPRLVKVIRDKDGARVNEVAKDLPPIVLNKHENWNAIHHSMEQVVHGHHGTARSTGYSIDYKMAGKTGTAQVFGIGQDEEYDEIEIADKLRDHALFIGFAPYEQPEIAVAVVAENGEHGSAVAPIAAKIMKRYFDKNKKNKK